MAFAGFVGGLHDAEIDLFRAMNLAGTNGLLDSVMLLLTFLGIGYVMVFVCVPLWLRGRRDAAFDVVILIILATLVAEIIKLIVDRQRPSLELSDVNTLVSASGPSFPSAHATRAFAVACLIVGTESRRIGLGALVLAAMISISRVYLGVHWPSDVLAGAILGALIAAMMMVCAKRVGFYKMLRQRVVSILSRKPV